MGWEPQSQSLCCRAWNPTSLDSVAGAGNSHQTSLDHKCSILDIKLPAEGERNIKVWPQLFCVCQSTPQPEDALNQVFLSQGSSGAGWIYFYTEYWGSGSSWQLLLKLNSYFLVLSTSEMRLDGSTDPWLLSVLVTPTLFPMPQQSAPQGSPLTCSCLLASWLSSHWNDSPENQTTAFKDTPFVFADHVKMTMTQMKSYLPLKLEKSQTS